MEFQPGEDGTVKLPEGNTLRPMTLYALFQDASEVVAEAAPAEETVPAETASAETVPVTTAPVETVPATTAAAETEAPETTEGA